MKSGSAYGAGLFEKSEPDPDRAFRNVGSGSRPDRFEGSVAVKQKTNSQISKNTCYKSVYLTHTDTPLIL